MVMVNNLILLLLLEKLLIPLLWNFEDFGGEPGLLNGRESFFGASKPLFEYIDKR
jgi:hypothetical protein